MGLERVLGLVWARGWELERATAPLMAAERLEGAVGEAGGRRGVVTQVGWRALCPAVAG